MLSLLALIAVGLFVLWFMLRLRKRVRSPTTQTAATNTERPLTRVAPTPHVFSDDEGDNGMKVYFPFSILFICTIQFPTITV
jgi:hypothetical protein